MASSPGRICVLLLPTQYCASAGLSWAVHLCCQRERGCCSPLYSEYSATECRWTCSYATTGNKLSMEWHSNVAILYDLTCDFCAETAAARLVSFYLSSHQWTDV